MPIDNIVQLVSGPTRSAGAGTGAPDRASAATRQGLPGSGQSVPPAKVDVQQAVSQINDFIQAFNRDLKFRVDRDTNQVVVTVMDSQSGEVIRQIPSEEVLAVARSLDQMSQGLLLNTKA
jgi:flagellar protein FlaG